MKQSPVDVLGFQNQKKVVIFCFMLSREFLLQIEASTSGKQLRCFETYRRFVAMATPCSLLSHPKVLHR